MPRYTADPTSVSASITILPKDDYLFKIGRPKSFERTAAKGHQSYGVRFPLTVVDGPQKGKTVLYSLYLHSEGGQSMGKRFQMAVAGFTVNQANEAEYNEQVSGLDWTFDPEDGSVGAGFAEYEGKHIECDLGVEMIKDEKSGKDMESQVWGVFRPVAAAVV